MMVTDKCGRLIAYSCRELGAYKCSQLNSLPYGISRAMAGAQAAANARADKLTATQEAADKIGALSYSALETAISKMQTAADKLLAALS